MAPRNQYGSIRQQNSLLRSKLLANALLEQLRNPNEENTDHAWKLLESFSYTRFGCSVNRIELSLMPNPFGLDARQRKQWGIGTIKQRKPGKPRSDKGKPKRSTPRQNDIS